MRIRKIMSEVRIAISIVASFWKDLKKSHELKRKREPQNPQEEELRKTIDEILSKNIDAQDYWIGTIDEEDWFF